MPGNESVNTGAEQQPQAGERAPPPAPLLPPTPDQVTPHKMAVVQLIVDNCEYRKEHLLSPAERSGLSLLLLDLVQCPDQSLALLCRRVAAVAPRPLLRRWTARLVQANEEGVAGTMDLFQAVEKLLEDSAQIHKSSVLGLVLRRVFLQFDKLSFSEVSSLQMRFSTFISRGQRQMANISVDGGAAASKSPECSGLDISMDMTDCSPTDSMVNQRLLAQIDKSQQEEDEEKEKFITRKQADLFIARQAHLLAYAESAALPPHQLQEELLVILRSNPGLLEAHFLSYLNCLRLKEVVGAMDSLYASSNRTVGQGKLSVEEVNKTYRYAGLTMAALHARLGHAGEALAAIRESVTIAQEARDHVCLQHALSWIARFSSGPQSLALLERSVAKCEQLNLPYLASLAMLGLCAFVEEFGCERPAYVLDLLTRSSVHNCRHNLAELQANAFMMRAGVWTSYGRPQMAATVCQLLLQLNTAEPLASIKGRKYEGEALVMALASMAVHLDAEGYTEEADAVVELAEQQYPCPESQHCHLWQVARQRIVYMRASRAANWAQAEQAMAFLAAHAGTAGGADFLAAELRFKQGDLTGARDILQRLMARLTTRTEAENNYASSDVGNLKGGSRELLVRCLMLLADIHSASNDTGEALEYLMKAVETASRHRFGLLQALACLQVANCQLTLGCIQRAVRLSRHCLCYLLSHAGRADRSRALLLAAKCRVADASRLPEWERRAGLLEGVRQVGDAKDGFTQVQDWGRVKDCLYLQARIYQALELTQERNLAAQQFNKLDSLYPTVVASHQFLLI